MTSKNAVSINVAAVDLVNILKPYRADGATQESITITGRDYDIAYLLNDSEGEVD